MERSALVSFLRDQKWAVEASVSVHGAPQAAVLGVVVTDDLEIFFDTFDDSRKAQNLRRNRKIALVVGWDDGRTVQIEGNADEPHGDELEALKALYFARFADGEERAKKAKIAYFRVRPTWIRISDFRNGDPVVETLKGGDLRGHRRHGHGKDTPAPLPPEPVVEAPIVEPEPEPIAPAADDEGAWDDADHSDADLPSSEGGASDEDEDDDVASGDDSGDDAPPSSEEPSSSSPRGSGQGSLF